MPKIIGIVGSRRRNSEEDFDVVYSEFQKWYEKGDKICSGGCPKGGDRFAEIIASRLNLDIIIHRPQSVPKGSPKWAYAKAFYERNTLVARDSDILIACVHPERTGGTEDTIKKFLRQGKTNLRIV